MIIVAIKASLITQLLKNVPAVQETPVQFLGRENPLEKGRLPTPVSLGFPCGSAGKESACRVGDLGSIPGFGRSPGEGIGYPLQYSGLENSMDCIVHGVANSRTRLSAFHIEIMMMRTNRDDILCKVPFTLEADSEQSYDDEKISKGGKHSQFFPFS